MGGGRATVPRRVCRHHTATGDVRQSSAFRNWSAAVPSNLRSPGRFGSARRLARFLRVPGFWESGSGTDVDEAMEQREPEDLVAGNESRKRRGIRQPRNVGMPLTLVGRVRDARRESVVPTRWANRRFGQRGRRSPRAFVRAWLSGGTTAITRRRRKSNDSDSARLRRSRASLCSGRWLSAERRFTRHGRRHSTGGWQSRQSSLKFGNVQRRCQPAWDRLDGLVSREDVHVVFESWELRESAVWQT